MNDTPEFSSGGRSPHYRTGGSGAPEGPPGPAQMPHGNVASAARTSAPTGDVGSATVASPQGDVRRVATINRFAPVVHTESPSPWGQLRSSIDRGITGRVSGITQAYSSPVGLAGHRLVNEGDEQSDATQAGRLAGRQGSRAGARTARTGATATGAGVRAVRYGIDRRAAGKDTAQQKLAARRQKGGARQSRRAASRTATHRIAAPVASAGRRFQTTSTLDQGGAAEGANETTTRWAVNSAARSVGITSRLGRSSVRGVWTRLGKPAGRWAWRRAVRPVGQAAGRAAGQAAARTARMIVKAVVAAAKAVEAGISAAMSSGAILVVIILLVIVAVIAALVNSFSIQSHNDEAAAASTFCGTGTGTITVPAPAKPWVAEGAKTSGLPAPYIAALMKIESDFDPALTNSLGYSGLLQIGAEEWAMVHAVGSRTDPMANAHYGGLLLKLRLGEVQKAIKKYPQLSKAPQTDLLAIAHNAGPGRIKDWTPDASRLPAETQGYLTKLHSYYKVTDPSTTGSDCGTTAASATADQAAFYAAMHAHGFTPGDPSYVVDSWNFYWGECTSFAAWAVVTHGTPTFRGKFTNNWGGAHFGNANHWDEAAASVGIPVDQTPAVGAVAQWNGGSAGHVAYITKVYPDKSFDIEESNFAKKHTFGTRTHMRIGVNFDNVIHFEKK